MGEICLSWNDTANAWRVYLTGLLARLIENSSALGRSAEPNEDSGTETESQDASVANTANKPVTLNKDELGALLKVFHERNNALKILDKDLTADKLKGDVLKGYIEEVQLLLGLTGADIDGVMGKVTRSKIPDKEHKLTESVILGLMLTEVLKDASTPAASSKFEDALETNANGNNRLTTIQTKLGMASPTGTIDPATRTLN